MTDSNVAGAGSTDNASNETTEYGTPSNGLPEDVCVIATDDASEGFASSVIVAKPDAGETFDIVIEPGKKYFFDFVEEDVQSFTKAGEDLTITFADGGALVLGGVTAAVASDLPAILAFKEEFTVNQFSSLIELADAAVGNEFVEDNPQSELRDDTAQTASDDSGESDTDGGQIFALQEMAEETPASESLSEELAQVEPAAGEDSALAQRVAQIEPAAGEADAGDASNSGYGFQSSFDPQGVNGIEDVGPIDPTQLAYNAPQQEQESFIPEGPDRISSSSNPNAGPSGIGLDETNLNGNALIGSGQLSIDFGADGPGSVLPNGGFTATCSLPGGLLTSGGDLVNVTEVSNGYVGATATQTVFRIEIDPESGDYTYTQFLPFDHADGSDDNDIVCLEFGVIASDFDGDSVNTTITIEIADDAPVLVDPAEHTIDETNLGPITVNDSLNYDFGEDGAGELAANDTFSATGSVLGGNLTSGGVDVVVTSTPNGYVGIAGGNTVFELSLDQNTGDYEFELFGNLDHADPNDPNDIIALNFGVEIQDFDGDTDLATIKINVKDDVPVVKDSNPQVGNGLENIDETNLGPITLGGTLNVDFGGDVPGSLGTNDTFDVSGSLLGGTLTSGGVDVVVAETATGYEGVAGGNTVFELTLNKTTGAYEFTQFLPLDHADATDHNDVITMKFGVEVQDADGDSDDGFITINIADDGPVALDDDNYVGNGQMFVTGDVIANDNYGEDGAGFVKEISFNGNEVEIAEGQSVTIDGQYGTLEIWSDGNYTYTAFGGQDGTDVFTYQIQDYDGDVAFADLTINVCVDDVPVIVKPNKGVVDETDIDAVDSTPDADVVSGTLQADFGQDGPGVFVGNGDFSTDGSVQGTQLTSGGEVVNVTYNENTGTYTGATAGETIFTLSINPETGQYTFNLFGPLDHDQDGPTAADHDDVIDLKFGFDAIDADGDKSSSYIEICVHDDGPILNTRAGEVDEDSLANGPIVIERSLFHNYGEDGPGEIEPTGTFETLYTVGGSPQQLTSGGENVTVTQVGDGYEGTLPDGTLVFTLEITNTTTGAHKYTQFLPVDHPNTNSPDDVIWLKFGVQIIDNDGDIATAKIVIDVRDSGPTAEDDKADLNSENKASGNVTSDDDYGQDGAGYVSKISFDGNDVAIEEGQSVTIDGQYGTLEIWSDGEYTYTAFGGQDGTDVFEYTIQDADGDMATATLTVCVEVDDVPKIVKPGKLIVDETDIDFADATPGADVVNGQISVDFGNDNPGTIVGNSAFTASGSVQGAQLTSGGDIVDVTYSLQTNTYTGVAAGETVFTLSINADTGAYTFNLLGTLDHADMSNPDDVIELQFGFDAIDADGDKSSSHIEICVHDDGPYAQDDDGHVNDSGIATGSVITNDDYGQDGAGYVKEISFKGNTLSIAEGQSATIEGDYGTLEILSNGAYTYTQTSVPVGTKYSYSIDNPPGSDNAGDIKNVNTSFDSDTNDFSFSLTVEPSAEGFTLAISDGANPKGHAGEMALIYFDDTGSEPVITIYSYNGQNAQTSWTDGSPQNGEQAPDLILSSLTNPELFDAIQVTTDGNGNKVFSFAMDASVIQNHDPAYGPDGEWTGVGFESMLGMWLHPVSGLETEYDQSGALTHWDADAQSWYDTAYRTTDHENPDCYDEFTYAIRDYDGDMAMADLVIKVSKDPDDVPEVVRPDVKTVDETDLGNDGIDSVSGLVTADFGADTPGSFETNGDFNFGGSATNGELTSCGHPVTVERDQDGHYVGSADGETIFTLTFNDDGSYTFDLLGTLDHADTNDDDDIINLFFGVDAVDSDGDRASTTIQINVKDDGPYIGDRWSTLDEDDLVNNPYISVTRTIDHDFGEDGAGEIEPSGSFETLFEMNGANQTLTSGGGQIVNVSTTANGYEGVRADGTLVFTLTVDALTGEYTYTQFVAVDHPDDMDHDDAIWLKFGVKITDKDGDTDTGIITIDIHDDGPFASDDIIVGDGNMSDIEGNVLDDDRFGADGPGFVKKITYDGVDYDIEEGSFVVVDLHNGTLTMRSDGNYLYVPEFRSDNDSFTFQYTIQDADGDMDTAQLFIDYRDPLVIDLDGDGVELLSLEDGVVFDIDGDGALEQTGWVESDDGFLVLDENNDGVINDGSEMFGDDTQTGFEELATHDVNGDGVINSDDDVWNDLQIWQDLNQDGVSQDNELYGLSEAGITSISLDTEESDAQIEGHLISETASVSYEDGTVTEIADVWFEQNSYEESADAFLFEAIADSVNAVRALDAVDLTDVADLIDQGQDSLQDTIDQFVWDTEAIADFVSSNVADYADNAVAVSDVFSPEDIDINATDGVL